MRALDDLVRTGKVLYVGVSNAPAWKIAQANTLADFHGWSPFIALQIEYNLTERTVERELIPMARELNLGVTPWSPLSAGVLSGKYKRTRQPPKKEEAVHRLDKVPTWRLSDRNLMIAEEVQKVADEIGRSSAQVALNWLLQKPGVTSLIIGARTIEQLKDNLSCLDFKLSPEYMERLDKISYVPLGFPYDFLAQDRIKDLMTGGAHIAQRQEYQ
jgi:aryl-alcohol dehydrogenase-like predicted oxidoreductase